MKSYLEFQGTFQRNLKIDCLVDNYKEDNQGIFIFLHGAGERSDDKDSRHDLSHIISQKIKDQTGLIFAFPFCEETLVWEPDKIAFLVEKLISEYKINPKKVYLGGHSMGARGTWFTSCIYPELFAGIFPVAGYSYYLMAERLRNMPIACFHGDKDDIVPLIESKKMISAVKDTGNKRVIFKILNGFNHNNSWFVFNTMDVYKWLQK